MRAASSPGSRLEKKSDALRTSLGGNKQASEQKKQSNTSMAAAKRSTDAEARVSNTTAAGSSTTTEVEMPVARGWLSWWWLTPDVEEEAHEEQHPTQTTAKQALSPADKPVRQKRAKVKVAMDNAKQAAAAREEKAERKRFQEQQQALIRQRRAQPREKTPMELEAAARKSAGRRGQNSNAATKVVSLASLSSEERAAVQKMLSSPVLS